MHYHISTSDIHTQFIDITYTISDNEQSEIDIQLPAWRPGRYELQNFAKNIQFIEAISNTGQKLNIHKITKDRWRIETDGQKQLQVRYAYYAVVQNAGTSYIDDNYWYLNFINFCFYTEGRIDEPCTITLDLPKNYEIACGLKTIAPHTLKANDFYELVDCPLLASKTLQHASYTVQDIVFHVWIQGNISPDWKRILDHFTAFSKEQVAMMGDFPEKDFHFLNLILPTPYYHGVEHRNSTMVVLGPDEATEELYNDLLGVSSHELFHAWNIIRIRPAELLPYDFTKENYFQTCFVAEGCTTYYGDLFLRRAGVFDDASYLKELYVYMKRHFENSGEAHQSLLESSFDLWLDGYEKGIPNRKVSVYHKGALVALILDLHLRQISNHIHSLDTVMQHMWQKFGKPFIGYTLEDYIEIVESIAGENLDWYWNTCIRSNEPLESLLTEKLKLVGIEFKMDAYTEIQLFCNDDPQAETQRSLWLSSVQ
jgi:predicted metalloprotease with PDZ domain